MINDVLADMIFYFGNDSKRINHAIKVFTFAKNIGKLEKISQKNQKTLEVAAILHDIGIKIAETKYNSSSGKYQEIEGPAVARKMLKKYNISKKSLERVCYLIGHHHTYSKIDGIDFQILIEADFIVNAYEDNLNIDQINAIRKKYFKTKAGIEYLKSMYN